MKLQQGTVICVIIGDTIRINDHCSPNSECAVRYIIHYEVGCYNVGHTSDTKRLDTKDKILSYVVVVTRLKKSGPWSLVYHFATLDGYIRRKRWSAAMTSMASAMVTSSR